MNEVENALQTKLDAFKENLNTEFASKETLTKELETLKADNEKLTKESNEFKEKTNKEIDTLIEQVKQMKDNQVVLETKEDLVQVVDKWLNENLETIKSNLKSGKGTVSLEGLEKAVANMTSANITLPTALPAGLVAETQGVPNVNLRRPTLLNNVNTFRTNQKTLTYVEAVAGEGDFAVVAEAGTKPQLDIDFQERFVQPTKFAGWIKVTDELMEDFPRMRDVIVNYLAEKHNLFKEAQVLAYINTNAVAYIGATNPLSGAVLMPNIMDVVAALQSQILATTNFTDEADFLGDTVLMNRGDFYRLFGSAKDAMGRPLYDNGYQLGNEFRYNGYTFIAHPKVTAGQIYLYDSTKIDVTSYIPYHVEIGWVNDDFIKNQFVILGESRGHIYIKNHDKRAFVKGAIATILTDITSTAPAE